MALTFATWFGANFGASSINTRPVSNSRYSVLSSSKGRQSDADDALMRSASVGLVAMSFAQTPDANNAPSKPMTAQTRRHAFFGMVVLNNVKRFIFFGY
jgi:hypothetical protein